MNEFQVGYQLVAVVSNLQHKFVIDASYNVTQDNENFFSQL